MYLSFCLFVFGALFVCIWCSVYVSGVLFACLPSMTLAFCLRFPFYFIYFSCGFVSLRFSCLSRLREDDARSIFQICESSMVHVL